MSMNKSNGFTLIEFMITLLVAGILMTVAAPSFTSMIKNSRLQSQQGAFIAGINLARSEAIKRAHNIVLCRSANGTSCAGSGGWEQGWLIYADADSDNTLDGGETVLKVQGELSGSNTLIPNANFTNRITYESTGFSTAVGSFALCDDRGDSEGVALIISASGRIRITDIASSSVTCP